MPTADMRRGQNAHGFIQLILIGWARSEFLQYSYIQRVIKWDQHLKFDAGVFEDVGNVS